MDPGTARRVWQFANELRYHPNAQARALVSGKSRIFGLVVPDLSDPFYSEFAKHFEMLAVEHGYDVLLVSLLSNPNIDLAVRRLVQRQVDGVAIITFGEEAPLIARLREVNVPLTFVLTGAESADAVGVRINHENGIRQAVEHLVANRHSKLAYVSGPCHSESALARKKAFERSLKVLNIRIRDEFLLEGDDSLAGGRGAAATLSAFGERPTAIVCSNDLTAIGVICEAFSRGWEIPRDASVIGFGDIGVAEFLVPALTTVRLPRSELAELTFQSLCNQVDGKLVATGEIATSLVVRKSTSLAKR